jgi:dUTP pyrophosphatase
MKYTLLNDGKFSGVDPKYGNRHAACFDIAIPAPVIIWPGSRETIDLLIAFEIPAGYTMLLMPRSSTFSKHGLISPTSVIDEDYRGSIHGLLHNTNSFIIHLPQGVRLFQALLVKSRQVKLECVDALKQTGRGGLGSTGA